MSTQEVARIGDWMQTCTGRAFWPLDPRPEEVCIEDVVYALSQMCRFGGHCRRFYSVAQHSVHVSELVSSKCGALWGLFHDAAEAYIGDHIRPIKSHLYVGNVLARHEPRPIGEIESKVLEAIACAIGLVWPIPPEILVQIRLADEIMLATEARDLMAPPPRPWLLAAQPMGPALIPLEPNHAAIRFVERFRWLRGAAA